MGKLPVTIEASVQVPLPRSGVNLVNVQWSPQPVPCCTVCQPPGIPPGYFTTSRCKGGIIGSQFVARGIGVGFEKNFTTIAVSQLIFVERIWRKAGDK